MIPFPNCRRLSLVPGRRLTTFGSAARGRQLAGSRGRRGYLACGLALGLLVLPLVGCERRSSESGQGGPPPRPNIIFILVDTLRADRLGCYGDERGLSRFMDGLAGEGVVFERVIATSSWTLPSVASYFCGYYPSVHKVTSYEEALRTARVVGGRVRYFGQQFTTLAEILRSHGYLTAGFSANPFISPKYGFAQGFEHFDASFADNATPGEVVNAAALRWLAQRDTSRPLFLYLHYMDVHDPYCANDQYVTPLIAAVEELPDKRVLTRAEAERHVRFFNKSAVFYRNSPRHRRLFQYAEYWQARYDAGVLQISQYLTELRDGLTKLGLWQDAYVIFTADHGESLGEHRLWAHGLSAHQDQLHVPLILRWPGRLPAGERIGQTVRLFDIMPTVLEQLGLPVPEGLQARSLVGLLAGRSEPWPPALAEAVKKKPGQKALVAGKWKLLAHTDEGRYELYDLDQDPTEQHDLAAAHPQRVAELRRLLEQQLAENQALGAEVQVQHAQVSPEELRRFQALGYFGGGPEEAAEDQTPAASSPSSGPATDPDAVGTPP